MADQHTALRQLTRLELAAKGIDLDSYVSERRAAGDSWMALSGRLRADSGILVPHATLHRWFRTEDVAA